MSTALAARAECFAAAGGCQMPLSTVTATTGTTGVLHIECRKHAGEPSEYLVSFGGELLWAPSTSAKASGFDPLTALLRKLGVPAPAMRIALQVLMSEAAPQDPERDR